jgi:hypothetical protein
MKKFSEIKTIKRFNEADDANDLKNLSIEELRKLAEKEGLIKNDENESNEDENSLTKQLVEEPVENESNEDNTSVDPAKFFSKLFESREMAHIYHLQVNGEMGSHAKHTALGDYYDGVLGLIDDMIEVYQGQYDIIDGYDVIDTKDTMSKETIEYFNELATFIKAERKCFNNEDTHLHNIVDEVVALVYKTLYKLRFNK